MLSDKKVFLATEVLLADLHGGAEPSIGIDVAANRDKGLRVIVRSVSGIWEAVLRFHKSPLITITEPFLDVRSEIEDFRCLETVIGVARAHRSHPDDARAFWTACERASSIAVDSPRRPFGPRTCDQLFHRMEISKGNKVIKRIGGVFWPKPELEILSALGAYTKGSVSIEQLQTLSDCLWMFVGCWLYRVLNIFPAKTIEVHPYACRVLCQEMRLDPKGADALDAQLSRWLPPGDSVGVDRIERFLSTKSETNDAAIASFTAFLHRKGLTQPMAPDCPDAMIVPRSWPWVE